jgi:hypothetical protein
MRGKTGVHKAQGVTFCHMGGVRVAEVSVGSLRAKPAVECAGLSQRLGTLAVSIGRKDSCETDFGEGSGAAY